MAKKFQHFLKASKNVGFVKLPRKSRISQDQTEKSQVLIDPRTLTFLLFAVRLQLTRIVNK